MSIEKRKSKRLELNVKVKVRKIEDCDYLIPIKDEFEVEVINVSKDGIAFRSAERMLLNTFYNVDVILWTKESFSAVIEIVRMENNGEAITTYGCRFVGISSADQFKIDVYQIVRDMDM